MSFINSVLKAFVGDKAKKDVKEIQPIVEKVKSFGAAMEALSNDSLRQKTHDFKAQISAGVADLQLEIEKLKMSFDQSVRSKEVDLRELYDEKFNSMKQDLLAEFEKDLKAYQKIIQKDMDENIDNLKKAFIEGKE